MGLNLDFCQMIGAPIDAFCPNCGDSIDCYFYDLDIESPSFMERLRNNPGEFKITSVCYKCNKEYELIFKIEKTSFSLKEL